MKNAFWPLSASLTDSTRHPGGFEVNAGKIGQNVEAMRIASETKEGGPVFEVLRMKAFEGYSKPRKHFLHGARVGGVSFDRSLDAFRKAGLRVKAHCVATDDQVFNATGMEGGKKVFVVLVHPAASPGL